MWCNWNSTNSNCTTSNELQMVSSDHKNRSVMLNFTMPLSFLASLQIVEERYFSQFNDTFEFIVFWLNSLISDRSSTMLQKCFNMALWFWWLWFVITFNLLTSLVATSIAELAKMLDPIPIPRIGTAEKNAQYAVTNTKSWAIE